MIDPDSSARLCAIVRSGPYRLAFAAERVLQVAHLGGRGASGDAASAGSSLHGAPVRALLEVLGDAAPQRGEWGIAVQGRTIQAYAVDGVEGISEQAPSPTFNLPLGVGAEPAELFRGVITQGGALALDVRPEALERPRGSPRPAAPSPTYAEGPVPRALVFTAAGRSLAFALPQVLSVVAQPTVCAVPRARAGVRGVVEHGQTLYPVIDLGALYFQRPSTGALGVLVEQQGRPFMVLADAVRGMVEDFRAVAGEPGWMESERGERALFFALGD